MTTRPNIKGVLLRLDSDLKAQLETAAREEERSVNNLATVIIKQWLAERAKRNEHKED